MKRSDRSGRRLLAALTIFALLLPGLSSCRSEPDEPETGPAETLTANIPADFVCTVVRGDESSRAVTDAAVALRKLLEEQNLTVEIKTDWVKRGEEIKRFRNEILIGPTNRPESEELYRRFASAAEPLDYLITVGEQNCIAATDECIREAAWIFVREYVRHIAGEEEENMELERKHVFPAAGMTLYGIGVSDWSIVCPPEYTAEERADFEKAADIFYRLTGERMSGEHRILVGTASPLTPRDDDLGYLVQFDGQDLHLGGGNPWADLRALYQGLFYGALGMDESLSLPDDLPGNLTLAEGVFPDTAKSRAFSISGWCTSGDAYDTETLVRQTAEAGFTKVSVAGIRDAALCRNMLRWCAIWDLEILWTGVSWDGFDESVWQGVSSAMDAPHVWGLYLCDEPNSSIFGGLAACVEKMQSLTDQTPFINLFPMYANEQQLGNPTYRAHVREFFETVSPPWASVDIYPCNTRGLYDGYMENLAIVADECRKRDVPFSVYLQSVSFAASKRTPSEKDLEWQTWCIRSFGASEAIYFTYMTPYSSAEDFKPALIDHDLMPTERWHAAKKINAEFAALDEAFARYPGNLGVFTVNDARAPYMKFSGQLDFSDVLPVIETDNRMLFGCFSDGAGGYAFTAVNCEDLQKDTAAEVRVKTDADVTLWQNGTSSLLTPDAEGFVSIKMENGEGVFCEIGR
ncbi:MAG: hypothetical protein J6V24_00775 [Clostridia bacterium]|nr:hypothetical protein [Clostridia bacterium]